MFLDKKEALVFMILTSKLIFGLLQINSASFLAELSSLKVALKLDHVVIKRNRAKDQDHHYEIHLLSQVQNNHYNQQTWQQIKILF